jgi:hypothetical protein
MSKGPHANVGARAIADPGHMIALAALAPSPLSSSCRCWPRRSSRGGPSRAFALGLMASGRNMGLMLGMRPEWFRQQQAEAYAQATVAGNQGADRACVCVWLPHIDPAIMLVGPALDEFIVGARAPRRRQARYLPRGVIKPYSRTRWADSLSCRSPHYGRWMSDKRRARQGPRPLPFWQGCRVIGHGEVFLMRNTA